VVVEVAAMPPPVASVELELQNKEQEEKAAKIKSKYGSQEMRRQQLRQFYQLSPLSPASRRRRSRRRLFCCLAMTVCRNRQIQQTKVQSSNDENVDMPGEDDARVKRSKMADTVQAC
jgi:hypothetical protein